MSTMIDDTNGGQPTLGLTADEVLTTTRAVRKRLDLSRDVPRELIEDCIRIALQAPSGRNRQRWDFIFIDDMELRTEVAEIWRNGLSKPAFNGTGHAQTRMQFDSGEWRRIAASLDHLAQNIEHVPVLLIPCVRVDSRAEIEAVRGQAGVWGSVLPAFWSFMLAARERGLGTAWTTAHLSYEREMAELLNIPYETVVQAALTPVAYTRGTRFKVASRADQHDFTHWNGWI